ncbi:hypothetical protein AGRO_4231 [Agrobacterium sp. ATCC 31749]|nr:hypothetical protein AGRO_4231 [Agrobacterium sp. ATCC 31749]
MASNGPRLVMLIIGKPLKADPTTKMHIVFPKNVKSKTGDPAQNLEFPHGLPLSRSKEP